MGIAMNLANERNGLTGLNPSVGCLIVKNNKILSFGQTGFNGRPHAEVEAIKNCKKKDLKSIDWLRQKVLKKNLNYPIWRFNKEKNIQIRLLRIIIQILQSY